MKILYKFASRERPDKFFACLDNIIENTRHDNYVILCSLDLDDTTMFNNEVIERLNKYSQVVYKFGTSKNKIDAINRDIELIPEWDILCNHSDDMVFIKEGFDLDILAAFEGFDGLVHFPDQQQKVLCTYAMLSRKYYDLDGYIYHPDFKSVFADNYQQYMAKKRFQYRLIDKPILEHRHFAWGYGEKDALLIKTENKETYHQDSLTYQKMIS